MEKWISTQEMMKILELSDSGVRKIIKAGHYKKQPLVIRESREKKGRPAFFILFNTQTNQPATGDNHEEPQKSLENPVDLPIQISQPHTAAVHGIGSGAHSKPSQSPLPIQPALSQQAQANALFPGKDMALIIQQTASMVISPQLEAEAIDPIDSSDDLPDFETLLYRKVQGKPASTQRSLRAYYRKKYEETGEMPAALFVDEGRRLAGRKSTLEQDIQSRFIDMVTKAADKDDIFNFYTKGTRKVSVFHRQLEKEFGQQIDVNKLHTIVRSCKLKPYLDMADDEEDSKKLPSFFKAEPVGSIIQMDGVEADYLEIMDAGRWCKPVWIEFFDLGSRKLLAMHSYLSESNANSVDIFTRFLLGNTFAHQRMKIRPDNAKGFLNLKRPIKELNNRYAIPDGFTFVDDFARAGTPKDKAHLESSHRAFHSYEGTIIKHFKDRIDSQYKKQKKTGNQLKTVTVTRLAISLAELNDSGITAEYMRQHNSYKHRFTEDGTQRSWIPDERWQAHLAENQTFRFSAADAELCRRYGYRKAAATIAKDGCITYLKQKYHVADQSLWSRHSSTKVKVSLIDDHLAIFRDSDEGVYLGDALALQAPVKSEKLIAREEAKVSKIHADNEFLAIVKELERYEMIIDKGINDKGGKLRQMIDSGLTLEITRQLLAADDVLFKERGRTIAGLNLLSSRLISYLRTHKPARLIPYAGVPSDDDKK